MQYGYVHLREAFASAMHREHDVLFCLSCRAAGSMPSLLHERSLFVLETTIITHLLVLTVQHKFWPLCLSELA